MGIHQATIWDDTLVTGADQRRMTVKKYLDSEFTIKDLGEADFFVGGEIEHTKGGLLISQH